LLSPLTFLCPLRVFAGPLGYLPLPPSVQDKIRVGLWCGCVWVLKVVAAVPWAPVLSGSRVLIPGLLAFAIVVGMYQGGAGSTQRCTALEVPVLFEAFSCFFSWQGGLHCVPIHTSRCHSHSPTLSLPLLATTSARKPHRDVPHTASARPCFSLLMLHSTPRP